MIYMLQEGDFSLDMCQWHLVAPEPGHHLAYGALLFINVLEANLLVWHCRATALSSVMALSRFS